jgi:hypothetical protein
VTGNTLAKHDLTVTIDNVGDVTFKENVKVDGTVTAKTGTGDITIGKKITTGEDVNMTVGTGDILVGETVNAGQDVNMTVGTGDIMVDQKVDAGQDVNMTVGSGNILVGDTVTAGENINMTVDRGSADSDYGGFILVGEEVTAKNGDISVTVNDGHVLIGKKVEAEKGSVDILSKNGYILVGDNGPDEKTVAAYKNVKLTTENGNIEIYGKTSTEIGDITVNAANENYEEGEDGQNIIFDLNGQLDSGNDATLTMTNGDLHVTDRVKAFNNFVAETKGKGDIMLDDDINVNKLTMNTENGNITVGKAVTANGDVAITAGTALNGAGNIMVGVNGQGSITSDNGNVTLDAKNGKVLIYGKTSAVNGDVTVRAASKEYVPGEEGYNIIIAKDSQGDPLVVAKNVTLETTNGDLLLTDAVQADQNLTINVFEEGNVELADVSVKGNTRITNTGLGSVSGKEIRSGGTTYVSLANGNIYLDLAKGEAVVLRLENPTENNTNEIRVGAVEAEASGGANPDVELAGNYINIGSIAATGGNSVLQLTAMGSGNQKLISGDFSVESLSSRNGTHMPYLWSNRGYVHVDEGNLTIDDVFAVDKVHLENNLTDLAIYGRTPTRDGEQLVYWNNLGMANSKSRLFRLYTNGKVRTRGAILIDAGRHYGKLYGDNLSVVDMMRERVTHEHGQYTFDSTLLTKPGQALREKILFGMDSTDVIIQKQTASDDEIIVE